MLTLGDSEGSGTEDVCEYHLRKGSLDDLRVSLAVHWRHLYSRLVVQMDPSRRTSSGMSRRGWDVDFDDWRESGRPRVRLLGVVSRLV